MAQSPIIEGTGRELLHHLKQFPNEHFRFIPVKSKAKAEKTPQAKPKQLQGRGMLADVLNSEEFMRRKHEDTLREDRPLR